jgi:aminopeptidase-like protein
VDRSDPSVTRNGQDMHLLATRLFPICRSLSGSGVRQTISILNDQLRDQTGGALGLTVSEVPSGTECFDWVVPPEWNVADAFVSDDSGKRVVDFGAHNLHLVGYSEPIDQEMSLEDLQSHLYSLPAQPHAIPYVTSYYRRSWGFCMRHADRERLRPGRYRVKIDSRLERGRLSYADLKIAGSSKQEILFSTYICHPSMGNNELSGPVLALSLARHVFELPSRRFSYRFVFAPETIGSIVYLSRHHEQLRQHVQAGFQLTCVGDDRAFSYLPSRRGNTLADRAALHALNHRAASFRRYSWLDRGSDERQYCAPGIDLPVASVMRSKYGEYAEYHTSLDDLALISPEGLGGAYWIYAEIIALLETNVRYRVTCLGEPQLGKRGLYPNTSVKGSGDAVRTMMNFISYCDGETDLISIAEKIGVYALDLAPTALRLEDAGLLERL